MADNKNTANTQPEMAPANADKQTLRRFLLTRRRALSASEVQTYGQQAQQHILHHLCWQEARQVLLYHPIQNELDTTALITAAWEAGKEVLLPRCLPDSEGEGTMCLAPCSCHADLREERFGLLEPDPTTCPPREPDDIGFHPDIAIIPGVGFDKSGNRLGFGAGYYDRYLTHEAMQRTTLIGFAYSFQIVTHIPPDPWDKPVHALCTEESLTWL